MHYWTDLKLDQSVEFMNREDANYAKRINITGDRNSTCVVANSTGLRYWSCAKEEYFICETGKEYNNTQGICKVEALSVKVDLFGANLFIHLIKATSYQAS